MTHTPWYDEQPERVAWELDQLQATGLTIEQEERREGLLLVRSTVEHRGEQLAIVITFPYEYPEAPPSIVGDRVVLDRHQDRLCRNFCLLENPDADWAPSRSAGELVHLLHKLLRDDEAGADAVAEGEADMPEPTSAYYQYDGVVLVPEQFLGAEIPRTRGSATLARSRLGHLLFLRRADGFEDAPRDLLERFASGGTAPAVWLAVDEPPDPADISAAVGLLLVDHAPTVLGQLRNRAKRSGRNRGAQQLLGITFLEEGPAVGEQRRTWVFFEVSISSADATPVVSRTFHAQAISLAERQRRLPELEALVDLRALVIGAGSLGSGVALELAKAGFGAIAIVDHDTYDVNNAVRHIVGVDFAGVPKAAAVAAECSEMNPFGEYEGHPIAVGASEETSDKLDELVAQADIVIETTGSQAVTRIVQNYCRKARKTLIVAALTAGSYGGELIVTRPAGGCFDCFVYAQEDNSIPEPPSGPAHRVTPIGCRHPAFSGAGFDATSLAADAVRTAVRATGRVAYPPLDYDWAVISFRTEPRWTQGGLHVHPDCHRSHA